MERGFRNSRILKSFALFESFVVQQLIFDRLSHLPAEEASTIDFVLLRSEASRKGAKLAKFDMQSFASFAP